MLLHLSLFSIVILLLPPLLLLLLLLLLLWIGSIEELGSKPRRLAVLLKLHCRSKSNLCGRKFVDESSREAVVVDPVEPENVLKVTEVLSSWLDFGFYLFGTEKIQNDNDFSLVFVWIFQIWFVFLGKNSYVTYFCIF